ncbi:MAG: G1 family glutamic endopeptidase [Terriglobales bacterium]
MHTQDKFAKLKVLAIAGSLLLSLTTLAPAENDAVRAIYASAANVATNIPDIRTYAEPPKGFNPVTAGDVELATYGFPPRPDKQADPDRYASWAQAMASARIRWNGELKAVAGAENGSAERGTVPAISSPLPEDTPPNGPQYQSNVNAAGVILINKLTKWSDKASFDQVESIMSVSKAQAPSSYGSCTYDYKEFSFAGIDSSYASLNSTFDTLTPGLQGGVYGDVPCSGGTAGTPFYYAEFGWMYPLSRGFAVNPGDVFWAFVQASGGANGYVYLEDLTTQVYASYSISTPGIVGHNVGWLVFTPCCTVAPDTFPLANTGTIFFDEASALTGSGGLFDAGSQASSTLILTMFDEGGGGETEYVTQGSGGNEGKYALNFHTTGCASEGGCTP